MRCEIGMAKACLADHHMGVLLSADGPFKGCKPVADGHAANKLKALPCDPPPEWRFYRSEEPSHQNHVVL